MRFFLHSFACATFAAAMFSGAAYAQSVISAHSGIVHYIEGEVSIDGTATNPKFGQFPEIKNTQVLETREGRAEILLNPGVFLRLAENSSFSMDSNTLSDTQVEILKGTALLEVAELLPGNSITARVAGLTVNFPKRGLFRLDAESASLKVLEGQAMVNVAGKNLTAKKGHSIQLEGAKLADSKFPASETDSFYRWSARRAGYIATANLTSARVANNSAVGGFGSYDGYYGSSYLGRSMWSWNPYFGMYTFLPGAGIAWSPFGSPYYSPGAAFNIYIPRGPGGLGYYGGRGTSAGSGVPTSIPSRVGPSEVRPQGGIPSNGRMGGGMPPARGNGGGGVPRGRVGR